MGKEEKKEKEEEEEERERERRREREIDREREKGTAVFGPWRHESSSSQRDSYALNSHLWAARPADLIAGRCYTLISRKTWSTHRATPPGSAIGLPHRVTPPG